MIYFDNSATTKPYEEVVDSFVKVSTEYFGNPSSLHNIGGKAEQLLTQARSQVARLLNVKDSEIYFTSGGTESNNLAIKGTALMYRGRGRHIISTTIEHPSVTEAINQLEQLGFEVTFVPVDSDGRVDAKEIEKAIRHDTILVSVMHINNEVGTIQPIKEIGTMLKEYPKILFHVDHVQGAGKVPINFYDCGIDLCTISGHKFHGLKGTGALFIRDGIRISPLLSGGNQELNTRSGTENVAGIVAMAKALRLTIQKRETGIHQMEVIKDILRDELEKIDGVKVHTPKEGSAPYILNFSVRGFRAEVFVHALEEQDIYVSTTSACSSKKKSPSKTLIAMGLPEEEANSAIRISLSFENTMEEAVYAADKIKQTIKQLGEVMN
ncbi:cysteine desulfurase [Bacillus methanolicus PB1]|uniref:Cysteine desulfurase n=1 Tax=Bacillus methanolicus PB1 TaxID=997296 RepID=I3DYF8_BACMT|nr:cysteine desulfurase family protein [Bacillus methanolicus]EIJ79279.1 cysteine desulfurase [Bacillus methanolicus PB1]